jgi:putative aminopeptidase FrvX
MHEESAQRVWIDEIKPLVDTVHEDNYGNVWGVIKSKLNADKPAYKVMLDAHMDEISFIVNEIGENGLIHPIKNGGIDIQLTPTKEVLILTENGQIEGVFGYLPIHQKKGKAADLKPEETNLFIDLGLTKDEVIAKGIKVGDPIVYKNTPRLLNSTTTLVSKALDDKIFAYINFKVVERLVKNKIELPFDLYIVSSCAEEIGGMIGAKNIAVEIKPDVAIVGDVHFDNSNPLTPDKKMLGTTAVLGSGCVINDGASVQKNFRKLIVNAANKNNIKYTLAHSTGFGGTNADSYCQSGIVCGLVSIPLKYMHTSNEFVNLNDVDEAIDLIYYTLQDIEYKHNFKNLNLD